MTIICKACNTDHADKYQRDEGCAVLRAEVRIASLYHNGGSASEIREAQGQRHEALGQLDKAKEMYAEAELFKQGIKPWEVRLPNYYAKKTEGN